MDMFLHFLQYIHAEMPAMIEIHACFHVIDLAKQYHECWWLGDVSTKAVIAMVTVNQFILNYFGPTEYGLSLFWGLALWYPLYILWNKPDMNG